LYLTYKINYFLLTTSFLPVRARKHLSTTCGYAKRQGKDGQATVSVKYNINKLT